MGDREEAVDTVVGFSLSASSCSTTSRRQSRGNRARPTCDHFRGLSDLRRREEWICGVRNETVRLLSKRSRAARGSLLPES